VVVCVSNNSKGGVALTNKVLYEDLLKPNYSSSFSIPFYFMIFFLIFFVTCLFIH